MSKYNKGKYQGEPFNKGAFGKGKYLYKLCVFHNFIKNKCLRCGKLQEKKA